MDEHAIRGIASLSIKPAMDRLEPRKEEDRRRPTEQESKQLGGHRRPSRNRRSSHNRQTHQQGVNRQLHPNSHNAFVDQPKRMPMHATGHALPTPQMIFEPRYKLAEEDEVSSDDNMSLLDSVETESSFDRQVQALALALTISPRTEHLQRNFLRELEFYINKNYNRTRFAPPTPYRLVPFGSCGLGIASSTSDLDVCLVDSTFPNGLTDTEEAQDLPYMYNVNHLKVCSHSYSFQAEPKLFNVWTAHNRWHSRSSRNSKYHVCQGKSLYPKDRNQGRTQDRPKRE